MYMYVLKWLDMFDLRTPDLVLSSLFMNRLCSEIMAFQFSFFYGNFHIYILRKDIFESKKHII